MRTSLIQRVADFVDAIGMRLSTQLKIDGLWIGVLNGDNNAVLLERTREALSLISSHDPVRYARIRRDIRRIWITTEPAGIGKYVERNKLIVLDARYFNEASSEVIASVIVHEATHARLARFGYGEAFRSRVERCCIRREVAFARRHPTGQPIADWATERLTFANDFWSDAVRRDRLRRSETEAAHDLGIPIWFVRIAHRLRDRKALRLRR